MSRRIVLQVAIEIYKHSLADREVIKAISETIDANIPGIECEEIKLLETENE